MTKKVIKKVPYGRIIFEGAGLGYHATKGWRRVSAPKIKMGVGYDKFMAFLARAK